MRMKRCDQISTCHACCEIYGAYVVMHSSVAVMDCNSVLAQRVLSYVYAGDMVILCLVVMGSMLACCLTCLFIYCIRRKKKRKEDETSADLITPLHSHHK